MNSFIVSICTHLFFISHLVAQNINSEINNWLSELPASTQYTILIYNPNTQDTLYQNNIYKSMIPASTTKLFTTAAALSLIDKNYELSTLLLTDDYDFSDSVIDGNIYIKGLGNAKLKYEDLDSLTTEIRSMGVKKITGGVIGDDTYFDNIYSRDDWIENERSNINLPPVSALVIDRNKLIVTLKTDKKIGEKLGYEVSPKCSFINVKMEGRITKFKARPRINLSIKNNGIEIRVSGGLKKRKSPRSYTVHIDNPPLYAAFVLHDLLRNKGIEINDYPAIGITPEVVYEINHSSAKLKDLVSEINKNSDNFLAECLFKIVGAFYGEDQGNSFYATQAVMNYIKENNIYDHGTAVVDGSGISRFNEITAAAIGGLLETIYFDDILFGDFYNSLAIAGVDGTLEDRFLNSIVQYNLRGKTGTLRGVSALSGYLTTRSNEDLIICIIMEFKEKGAEYHRNIQDEILELTAREK